VSIRQQLAQSVKLRPDSRAEGLHRLCPPGRDHNALSLDSPTRQAQPCCRSTVSRSRASGFSVVQCVAMTQPEDNGSISLARLIMEEPWLAKDVEIGYGCCREVRTLMMDENIKK